MEGYVWQCSYGEKEMDVIKLEETEAFSKWMKKIKDPQLVNRILRRFNQVKQGNFGDYKSLGDGVSELRIDYGQGYRIYYTIRQKVIVILLCGGDKSTQANEIQKAKNLCKNLA